MKLESRAVADGVDLTFTITNPTDRTWSELAGMNPGLSPGSPDPGHPDPPINENLRDEKQEKTYYLGRNGLMPLKGIDYHFNHLISTHYPRNLF